MIMSEDEELGGPPFLAWHLEEGDADALASHVAEAIGKGGSSLGEHASYRVTQVRSEHGTAALSWDGKIRGGSWEHVETAWEEVTALLDGRTKGKSPEDFWQDVRIKWVPQRSGLVETYSVSGHIESRAYWYDGLRNGKAKLYDANGNFEEEGWFRDGLREGLWPDTTPGPTKKKIRYHLGERVKW
jgi:hypothetical protein